MGFVCCFVAFLSFHWVFDGGATHSWEFVGESVSNPLDVLGPFFGIGLVFVGTRSVLLVVQWDHLGTSWVCPGFGLGIHRA